MKRSRLSLVLVAFFFAALAPRAWAEQVRICGTYEAGSDIGPGGALLDSITAPADKSGAGKSYFVTPNSGEGEDSPEDLAFRQALLKRLVSGSAYCLQGEAWMNPYAGGELPMLRVDWALPAN
jgi:hypothetical protein